ncbi:MAG: efflux transporter outer membrane subunit, partial [Pseudomonadota bacterium]
MNRLHRLALLGLLALAGCASLPVEEPASTLPSAAAEDRWQTPSAIASQTQGEALPATDWWRLFGDDTLSELIATGLAANQDIAIASARLQQAGAAVRNARSGRRPQLDFAVNARRAEVSSQGAGAASQLNGAGLINDVNEFYDLGANLSWEVDLFGRLGAQISAAESNRAASLADQRGVQLTVTSAIASAYLELRALQAQLAVERANVRISEEQYTLARDLAASGLSPELDALRAQGQFESSRARLPALEAQIAGQRFALATLIGGTPGSIEALVADTGEQPAPPALLPVGVRSDLLRRRPDVTAAGWRLQAATSSLEASAKIRFPQLILTGAGGTDAGSFLDMLEASSVTWLLGAAVNLPLYR